MKDSNFIKARDGFGLARKSVNNNQPVSDIELFGKEFPHVIEGAELFDAVCPVSKTTGHRINPLALLGLLTGAKADVLNSLLQELPVVASDPNLTDEDRAQFVVEHCSTGTPAEDALMAKRIMNDLDALGLKPKDVNTPITSDSSITFEETDAPKSE